MSNKRGGRSLTEVAEEQENKLAAVGDMFGSKAAEEKLPKPPKPEWVTPSIQMTPDDLDLLRRVATVRAGRGRVSISAVIQKLIEDAREALTKEAGR
jgi:hypothetical protein